MWSILVHAAFTVVGLVVVVGIALILNQLYQGDL